MATGRVHAIRGNSTVVFFEGRRYACRIRGKLKKERWGTLKAATVGDTVEFEPLPDNEGLILSVHPRRTKLSRQDPHNPRIEQVIVANADALVAVHAAAEPELNLTNVDRCMVLAEAAEVKPVLVINKMDIAPEKTRERVDPYRRIGIELFWVSALQGDGVEEMKRFLEGKTSVFLGPSGAGKSTLLNAIDPSFGLKVREVSRHTGGGTYTTSWVELLDIGGGLVADTPGLEFFSLWDVTQENLHEHFPEFDAYHGRCGFSDCRHRAEPRCAVKRAVGAGEILDTRYASYEAIHATVPER